MYWNKVTRTTGLICVVGLTLTWDVLKFGKPRKIKKEWLD